MKLWHHGSHRSVNREIFIHKMDMEENKQKKPMQETTKDDSSDTEKVSRDKQTPPPQPNKGKPGSAAKEAEEAEKGHA